VIRLAVRCSPELAEQVLAELVEIVPGGVEEERGETYVEYAIYGPPGEIPELPEIEAAAGDGLVAIETTEIPDDWADRWRDFHEPVEVGDWLVVRPSWETAPAQSSNGERLEIVIDPGRAFGTGAHATTALSLELLGDLAEESPERGSVADLGTGSGVLAIAAAKLGYGPVLALDHEAPAVEAAAENAALNGAKIEVERRNLREQPGPQADVWLANLTAPLLTAVAGLMPGPGAGGPAELVVSGLLTRERGLVSDAFAARGYDAVAYRDGGDWGALRLSAPGV
jgi:ribosomal protein L11 methyltransferase